jgi:MoaA/NifB/PqqE/SkfB family radical SAM enzyme
MNPAHAKRHGQGTRTMYDVLGGFETCPYDFKNSKINDVSPRWGFEFFGETCSGGLRRPAMKLAVPPGLWGTWGLQRGGERATIAGMMNLQDNVYNQRVGREGAKLKLWRYAGLMLTYRCSAACAFCYYCCDPGKGGLMETATAIGAWEGLIRLAGESARVHLTGGEPFLVFDRLAEIVEQSHKMGLKGLEYVETNASWATHEGEIREKLEFLSAHGMEKLKISCDPFHLEFIPIENVRRLQSAAEKILGNGRVMVRWERYLQNPVNFSGISESEKQEIYRQALQDDPCRLTGRAALVLGDLLEQKPVSEFAGRSCASSFLGAKGVHIDPYGTVFCGQCSGISAGNVTQATLDTIWRQFDPEQMEFWKTLFSEGPCGLLDYARQKGYNGRDKFATKCHICTELRRFFFDKKIFWPIISPYECYHL